MVSAAALGRRRFLTGAAALAAWPAAGRAAAAPRLAAIDWAMLETAAAIGHMPVAACELIRFRADTITPTIPADVVDLGLRGAPNFELLQLVRPTLILSSPFYTRHETRLAAVAPVLSLPFFTPGEAPLPKALTALTALAEAAGDPAAGMVARARAEAPLDDLARRLRRFADRPVMLIELGDARHMRVFGFDSLFGSTATRLGLANAWDGATRFSFLAPVPIEELARSPEARLILIGPPPPEAERALARSVLWRRLPPVAAGRVHHLPPANAFGGVPAALRFAVALTEALEGETEGETQARTAPRKDARAEPLREVPADTRHKPRPDTHLGSLSDPHPDPLPDERAEALPPVRPPSLSLSDPLDDQLAGSFPKARTGLLRASRTTPLRGARGSARALSLT